ncbi:uncharacterized protein FIBRA_07263 [Fibroporia radiculosa]|uniref:Uncharacterized protein n=1 Tax=Fibroporia radiculosa TaxID=599839 RepID=J4GDY6_9APHY|nr:uncharacterized protein FIBRA_07263 [Fibroporia radiculosa]CCM05058.1 predicted protein [Fibroporia radiculosa]
MREADTVARGLLAASPDGMAEGRDGGDEEEEEEEEEKKKKENAADDAPKEEEPENWLPGARHLTPAPPVPARPVPRVIANLRTSTADCRLRLRAWPPLLTPSTRRRRPPSRATRPRLVDALPPPSSPTVSSPLLRPLHSFPSSIHPSHRWIRYPSSSLI